MQLTDFKVLTFDCYGTLIDWESGMVEALQPLRRDGRAAALARRDPRGACAPRIRAAAHDAGEALQRAARGRLQAPRRGMGRRRSSWDECVAYGRSIRDWPAFADSAEALRYLKQHYKLVDPLERRQRELRLLQQEARRRVRRDLHRRGHRLLQALAAQFRIHAGEARRPRHREERHSAHGGKPVPRPRARQRLRARVVLDPSPPRAGGFGATMNPGKMPRTDFRFTSMAETREGASGGARARLTWGLSSQVADRRAPRRF